MSHEQVTTPSHQKLLRQNLKNLSKCFLRLEGPPVRKSRREPWNYLSNLATGASTHEQVAKLSREKSKNPDFKKKKKKERKFLSLFRDRDFDPPVSRENLLCKLMTGACDWLDSWGKSPKQGCTVFEIFKNFQNKNTFQK